MIKIKIKLNQLVKIVLIMNDMLLDLLNEIKEQIYNKFRLWMVAIVYFTVATVYHTQPTETVFTEWLYQVNETLLIYGLFLFINRIIRVINRLSIESNKLPFNKNAILLSTYSIMVYKLVRLGIVTLGAVYSNGNLDKLYDYNLDYIPSILLSIVLLFLSLFIRYILTKCKERVD